MNERSNEELVAFAIDNNQEAIAELYNRTYAQGFAVALQMVKNEQEAMDIMQEAYISAFRNLKKLDEAKKFKSWFNCIVANKCRDYLRKHKEIVFSDLQVEEDIEFEDTLESDTIEFSPETSVDYSETKRLMNEILQGLPQEQRLCILMFYYNELSVKEIAESLKCSENTVKSRLNYARRKIKDDVKALEMKGTKLYNVAPIPFIIWMLHSGESEIVSCTVGVQLWGAVQQGIGKHFLGKGLSTKVLKTVAGIGTKKAIALTIGVVSTVAVGGTAVVVGITRNDNKTNQTESVTETESDEEKTSDATALTIELKDKVFTISNFAELTEEFLINTVSEESEYNMSFVGYEKVAGLDAVNDEYIATLKESINEEPSIENLVVDIPTEEGVYRSVISFKDQYKNEALVEVYIVYDAQDPVEEETTSSTKESNNTSSTGGFVDKVYNFFSTTEVKFYDAPDTNANVVTTQKSYTLLVFEAYNSQIGWYRTRIGINNQTYTAYCKEENFLTTEQYRAILNQGVSAEYALLPCVQEPENYTNNFITGCSHYSIDTACIHIKGQHNFVPVELMEKCLERWREAEDEWNAAHEYYAVRQSDGSIVVENSYSWFTVETYSSEEEFYASSYYKPNVVIFDSYEAVGEHKDQYSLTEVYKVLNGD